MISTSGVSPVLRDVEMLLKVRLTRSVRHHLERANEIKRRQGVLKDSLRWGQENPLLRLHKTMRVDK